MHDPGSHEGRFELGIEVQRALSTRMLRMCRGVSVIWASQAEGQDRGAEPYLFDGNLLSVRLMTRKFLNSHSLWNG